MAGAGEVGQGTGGMTRVVPSQIVEMIDRLFTGPSKGVGTAALSLDRIHHLQGVARLIRDVPNELLAVDAADFADLTIAVGAIELLMSRWINSTYCNC